MTRFKSKLITGEMLNGCWLGMYSAVATHIVAQAGYDVGMIDLEHGPGSYMDALGIMPDLENNHCIAAIRIPFAHEAEVKKAMDIGPMGILVPNLRTADEARYMVNATRYGPKGIRGAAPGIIRATGYGQSLEDYDDFLENEFLLMGQIESKQAVDQVDEIAAVEGLDMLFIGPYDLSASLGDPGNFDTDEFITACKKIESTAKQAEKMLGTIPIPTRSASQLYQAGHQLVLSGTDTLLLKSAAMQDVKAMNKLKIV